MCDFRKVIKDDSYKKHWYFFDYLGNRIETPEQYKKFPILSDSHNNELINKMETLRRHFCDFQEKS